MTQNNIAAVILAGGYSSRMEQFKPLLPLNGSTVVENVVHNFRKAGMADLTIVVGHNADALRRSVEGLGVRVVFNSKYAEGMYSSVVAGISALEANVDGCLLIPADMPLVRSSTVTRVCNAFRQVGTSVVYPVFQKRRGHPTLISSRLFSAIISGDGAGGLRALLAEHDTDAYEEKIFDEGILIDLDTPADYRKATELFGQRDIPTPAECQAILDEWAVPVNIMCHSRRVAEVAEKLSLRLNDAGLHLNLALVRAAALLHDMAKGRSDHACLAARALEELEFPGVARVVGLHTDCDFKENSPLDEAAIVYLADKLVQGDRIVSLAERFQRAFANADANGTLPFVQKRWETAQSIVSAVESMVGADLRGIISPQIDLPAAMVNDAPIL
jgi:CTP:molybdopterin cytidylyltransferase MocA